MWNSARKTAINSIINFCYLLPLLTINYNSFSFDQNFLIDGFWPIYSQLSGYKICYNLRLTVYPKPYVFSNQIHFLNMIVTSLSIKSN